MIRIEGLRIERTPEGITILSGVLDQAALHGVLKQIRDLGLKIISAAVVDTQRSDGEEHAG